MAVCQAMSRHLVVAELCAQQNEGEWGGGVAQQMRLFICVCACVRRVCVVVVGGGEGTWWGEGRATGGSAQFGTA